jgi:hypothetical protein
MLSARMVLLNRAACGNCAGQVFPLLNESPRHWRSQKDKTMRARTRF